MTAIEKLQQKLNIEIDEMYNYNMYDLEVSTYNTADGYEVFIMKSSPFENQLDWENDVFYYQPSFDDIEQYMPEYEIERWINDNEDAND